jgi:glycosyltransferase involved in cell wall biosynthesis
MHKRGDACNYVFFEQVTRPFPRKLFGSDSQELPFGQGKVSYEDLKKAMRDHRVYFYTGTHPASYTLNFMEAMTSGIPMVCIGPIHGNSSFYKGHNLYEIPDFIRNGQNGFISDNQDELRYYIQALFDDHNLAKAISREGRQTAIRLFSKEFIKPQWKAFLDSI